jgi:hypothetical protein
MDAEAPGAAPPPPPAPPPTAAAAFAALHAQIAWNGAGGWEWEECGDCWVWCSTGGWLEHHTTRWWRELPVEGIYIGINCEAVPVTAAMVGRNLALQLLPVRLQAVALMDPNGNLYVRNGRGHLLGLDELPAWPSLPRPLDAGEQADLDRLLLQLTSPISRATAYKLIGGSTARRWRIWSRVPAKWKLSRGRPRGIRLSEASATLIDLRKK